LPVPSATDCRGVNPVDLALHGGDDYELLFTVSPAKFARVPKRFHTLPLTRVGVITRERTVHVVDAEGGEGHLNRGGWDPFRARK
jgi:thiamine-monophosphate kinase